MPERDDYLVIIRCTFLILFIGYIVISFLFNLDPCFVFFFVIFWNKKEKKFATPFDV